MPELHDAPLIDIPAEVLYRILELRSQVFVVEQACVYQDVDGRDAEPGARLLWITDDNNDGGSVVATARLLVEPGGGTRIGRVATTPSARGAGLAGRLVEHSLATAPGPWVLDAQTRLAEWYERYGFVVDGDPFVEDGIDHVPMRLSRG